MKKRPGRDYMPGCFYWLICDQAMKVGGSSPLISPTS